MKDLNATPDMQRVLVMGGLGFIGSRLCRALLQEGYRVRIFDKLYGSHNLISDIEAQVEIIESDIERPEDVLSALEGVDVAVHLIHTTVPGSSMLDPAYDVQSNVVSSARWLSSLKDKGLARIIYISSGGTVYGNPKTNPITEDHPTEPVSSYGITKLAVEKYVAMYANLFDLQYRIGRPSNVYGEGQRLNIGQGVIGVFLDRALEGKPIEIWGDGTTKRDYIYVEDLVKGILKLLRHEGEGRVFNISTAVGYSLNEIIAIIRDETKLPVEVVYKQARGYDVPVNVLDNAHIKSELGWQPETNLREGIRNVYQWIRATKKR